MKEIKRLIYDLWMCNALTDEQIAQCKQIEGEMIEAEVEEIVEWDK